MKNIKEISFLIEEERNKQGFQWCAAVMRFHDTDKEITSNAGKIPIGASPEAVKEVMENHVKQLFFWLPK